MVINAMLVHPDGLFEAPKNVISSVAKHTEVKITVIAIGDASPLVNDTGIDFPQTYVISSLLHPRLFHRLPRIVYDLRILDIFKLGYLIKRIDDAHKIDVLHLHNVSTGIYSLALRPFLDRPILSHIYFPFSRSFRDLTHLAALKTDIPSHYVCINSFLVHYMKSLGIDSKKITYQPCPVDTNRFIPMDNGWLKYRFGIRRKAKVIAYMGRISPKRNPLLVAEAFKRINHLVPDLFLLICYPPGRNKREAKYINTLIKFIKRELHDKAIFLNAYQNIEEVYNLADILVFPFKEPYLPMDPPLTLLESMSCGKIVITSRMGEIAYLIENGSNGFIIDPYDVEDLTSKLEYILDHISTLKSIGQNARKTILMRHSMVKAARQIQHIYKALM